MLPCRAHEQVVPQVVGIDASELESSAAQFNSKQVREGGLPIFHVTISGESCTGVLAAG